METQQLVNLVLDALDDMKAKDVKVIDVHDQSDVTDVMIIASGNSDRHVKSIAQEVAFQAKQQGVRPLGIEGEQHADWVLVDLNDVLVHVMLPRTRDFYNLEKLWDRSSVITRRSGRA